MFKKKREVILYQGDTKFDHYQVVDMVYENRRARILFSGNRDAAFSGMPLDGGNELLFDYIRRLFELVSQLRPQRLLIIGGGVYTLPTALIQSLPDIKIDVVEIDDELDTLARDFFNFKPDPRVHIIHAEGKDFLKSTGNIYDMIIVDAFTELRIPDSLAGVDTAKLMSARLTKNGVAAVNIISSCKGRNASTIQNFYNMYKAIYAQAEVYPADTDMSPWMSQNLILIGQKVIPGQGYGMRYGALDIRDLIAN